jgi:hypothetical protein
MAAYFEQKIAKITKGGNTRISCTNTLRIRPGRKQLFTDISKRRPLMHFDRFAYEKVAPRVGFPSRDRLSDLCDLL